jgi:restriction system protein
MELVLLALAAIATPFLWCLISGCLADERRKRAKHRRSHASGKPSSETSLGSLLRQLWTARLVAKLPPKAQELLKTDWRSLRDTDFEDFVQALYEEDGYTVDTTPRTHDFGADLVAEKDSLRLAIQAKGWANNVGIRAVQEVVGSKEYYACTESAVITNAGFTHPAKELAAANDCQLIDSTAIEKMIAKTLGGKCRSRVNTTPDFPAATLPTDEEARASFNLPPIPPPIADFITGLFTRHKPKPPARPTRKARPPSPTRVIEIDEPKPTARPKPRTADQPQPARQKRR